MYQPIKPAHKKPILVKTDGKYNLKQLAVDRVEAEDGQYDVLFIGTGKDTESIDTFQLALRQLLSVSNYHVVPLAYLHTAKDTMTK